MTARDVKFLGRREEGETAYTGGEGEYSTSAPEDLQDIPF